MIEMIMPTVCIFGGLILLEFLWNWRIGRRFNYLFNKKNESSNNEQPFKEIIESKED